MILLINICKEQLHYFEFVKPIVELLKRDKQETKVVHYHDLNKKDLQKADKIIIAGTSLKDNQFLKDLDEFEWIKDFKKPILGICGGMQIISLLFNGRLKKQQEVGFYEEDFKTAFLGLKGKKQVYHLHNNYTNLPKDFKSYTKGKILQAIKHKSKPIYGVLFHPEVRNKEMIGGFSKL